MIFQVEPKDYSANAEKAEDCLSLDLPSLQSLQSMAWLSPSLACLDCSYKQSINQCRDTAPAHQGFLHDKIHLIVQHVMTVLPHRETSLSYLYRAN